VSVGHALPVSPVVLSLRNDPDGSYEVLEEPSVGAAVQALASLDGKRHNELSLASPSGELLVGGGPDRFVVGFVDPDGGIQEFIVDESAPAATLILGGQPTDLPGRLLVDRAEAERLVTSFVELGSRPVGTWETK
jgi:hypothetical protein